MATDPVATRLAVKRAICEQADQYTDSKVTVSPNDPGRDLKDRHIFAGELTGTAEYTTMARAEMPHEDRFTIEFMCYALEPDRADLAHIEDEVAAMGDALNRAVSLNAALDVLSEEFYVFDVLLDSVDGPYAWFTDNGAEGYCTVRIAAHTRVVNT